MMHLLLEAVDMLEIEREKEMPLPVALCPPHAPNYVEATRAWVGFITKINDPSVKPPKNVFLEYIEEASFSRHHWGDITGEASFGRPKVI